MEDDAVAAIEEVYSDPARAAARGPTRMHWDTVVLQLALLRELRAIRECLARDGAAASRSAPREAGPRERSR